MGTGILTGSVIVVAMGLWQSWLTRRAGEVRRGLYYVPPWFTWLGVVGIVVGGLLWAVGR